MITEPPVVLRTDRQPLGADVAATGSITGFDNEDGRHLQLAMPGTRSGTQLVLRVEPGRPLCRADPSGLTTSGSSSGGPSMPTASA